MQGEPSSSLRGDEPGADVVMERRKASCASLNKKQDERCNMDNTTIYKL